MKQVITIKNVRKEYQNGGVNTEVIKGVSLDINKGEFVSIMGPSGSGKSTLLYLMGGLENCTEGTIEINGKPIEKMNDTDESKMRRKDIGFVFQFFNLIPHLTVEENIILPIIIDGGKPKKYKDQLDKLLNLVGLTDKRHSKPSQLSGGQQQRVAIARALINDPEIILADEPIGNLDSKTGETIMNLFRRINLEEGKTIIQVTHSEESAAYGNRIVNVLDGLLV
ncbi:putative ABC transport system ATP-binding protein [Natranaerovirga pectinivora]|uniref:Putative ABC transport system ATP-binding protein n=1 Tax=Natranaerovirga pectinivora TaxID=682400 RepID=A0A4R3MDL3_9FIRM|nr:ABC transporter ATP-binding protein [Natranaerovirga pectinivora]TCT11641.1 putative ABC transport system ATP-binding protein [Natranaerovirga pectinivora]